MPAKRLFPLLFTVSSMSVTTRILRTVLCGVTGAGNRKFSIHLGHWSLAPVSCALRMMALRFPDLVVVADVYPPMSAIVVGPDRVVGRDDGMCRIII